MKAGPLQLVPHEHTGKIRPHRHTSYAGLFFVLVFVGILLMGLSLASESAVPAVNPQAGSVGLSGTVRGPAPQTAAVILTPQSGSTTNAIPITVSGTCPKNTFVSIDKNGVFGGVAACSDDGTFTLLMDLFDGANSLVARVADALGQYGPDSVAVQVFYNAPSLNVPGGGAIGRQLFLQTNTTIAGTDPNVSLSRSVTLVGGIGPYAISWDFGDGETSLMSQAGEGPVSANHIYKRAGTYRVTVRVTDAVGNGAFMQLVTVVNGPVEPFGATGGMGLGALPGGLVAAWPLFLLAVGMVWLFWLGERREVRKLRRRGVAV